MICLCGIRISWVFTVILYYSCQRFPKDNYAGICSTGSNRNIMMIFSEKGLPIVVFSIIFRLIIGQCVV